MSPDRAREDAAFVESAIERVVRHVRLMAALEAIGWGTAAAMLSRSIAAGVVIAAGVAAWRRRETTRAAAVRRIERAYPASKNLFVSADEIAFGRLTTTDPVRERVFADAAEVAKTIALRAIDRGRRAIAAAAIAVLTIAIAAMLPQWPKRVADAAAIVRSASNPRRAPLAGRLRITATIQPPSYTGVTATTVDDPEQVRALEGSGLTIAVDADVDRITVVHDGASTTIDKAGGRFLYRTTVTKTGFLIVSADGAAGHTMPIVVSADALPAVRLTSPGHDLVYGDGNPVVAFEARATDDYGLRSLTLHYTKVSGSGENFEFQDGEIPLDVKPANTRDWSGRAVRSIANLQLKDGDLLVYRAVASDQRPGDGSASSDSYIIEISRRGVAAGDAFTLPEEESRYALSQQMLIVKTERLHRLRASLGTGELSEAALNLAAEQRMIRAEFVFMLGGEIEDEDVEAERSTELQEGRLANRGQRDLRAATVAMSRAEQLLAAEKTGDALAAERDAVAALQRAFARGRYILRAFAERSRLDRARRLTGALAGTVQWRRTSAPAPPNRRAALLQDLLGGIAALQRAPGRDDPGARLLAAEALRIDPDSDSLRQAAIALQRAAAAADGAARASALSNAAAAARDEARRAHADASPSAAPPAAALSGAFVDALSRGRGGSPQDRVRR